MITAAVDRSRSSRGTPQHRPSSAGSTYTRSGTSGPGRSTVPKGRR